MKTSLEVGQQYFVQDIPVEVTDLQQINPETDSGSENLEVTLKILGEAFDPLAVSMALMFAPLEDGLKIRGVKTNKLNEGIVTVVYG